MKNAYLLCNSKLYNELFVLFPIMTNWKFMNVSITWHSNETNSVYDRIMVFIQLTLNVSFTFHSDFQIKIDVSLKQTLNSIIYMASHKKITVLSITLNSDLVVKTVLILTIVISCYLFSYVSTISKNSTDLSIITFGGTC